MDNQEKKHVRQIDFQRIVKDVWKSRMLYIKVLPVAFILACLYIICIPREYTSDTAMAPELENGSTGGTLSSLAASFGFDMSSMQSSDAITPLLYPNLMDDNGFVASLLKIQIETEDKEIKTDYYTYLKNHQKYPWWSVIISNVKKLFRTSKKGPAGEFNPYYLSRADSDIFGGVRNNIILAVDKKTGVISISATAQDALVCKTLADSVRTYLQKHITNYRTTKARADYEHYKELAAQTKADYDEARKKYGQFADTNMEMVLQSYRSQQDELENDLQLKFNAYSAMVNQMNAARTKIQEQTPAFTTIKGASVPIKPSKPKRMFFVIGVCFLVACALTVYVIRDYLFKD